MILAAELPGEGFHSGAAKQGKGWELPGEGFHSGAVKQGKG